MSVNKGPEIVLELIDRGKTTRTSIYHVPQLGARIRLNSKEYKVEFVVYDFDLDKTIVSATIIK